VAQRDADLLTAVLEDIHVLDVGQAAQLVGAVAPDLDEVTDVLDALLAERRIVVGCVADDLRPALVSGVRGKFVLEDDDVVVGFGDLGLGLARSRRAQRAVLGGRVVCAVLPPGRDGDPFLEKRVPAELAQDFFS
jgi:hypothetical protein